MLATVLPSFIKPQKGPSAQAGIELQSPCWILAGIDLGLTLKTIALMIRTRSIIRLIIRDGPLSTDDFKAENLSEPCRIFKE